MNARLVLAAVALLLGTPSSARPATPTAGRIAGTLAFREGDRRVTPADAERLFHRRISVALRQGDDVATARLSSTGRFDATLPAGYWRLEWIDVGDRAEVLPRPLGFVVSGGETTCAGLVELSYRDLASELGASAVGTIRVEPGCPAGDPIAGAPARDAFAPEANEPRIGFPERAEGLRVEGFFVDQEPGARVSLAIPLRRPLGFPGGLVVEGGASRLFSVDGARDGVELGAGVTPYAGAELSAGVRWQRGGTRGPAPWAGLRLGPAAYAFDVRAELRDGVAWSFGLELSLFHAVGRLF